MQNPSQPTVLPECLLSRKDAVQRLGRQGLGMGVVCEQQSDPRLLTQLLQRLIQRLGRDMEPCGLRRGRDLGGGTGDEEQDNQARQELKNARKLILLNSLLFTEPSLAD